MALQFLNPKTELADHNGARWVLVPVPYDNTACYRSGARDGPYHILMASHQLESFDEETMTEACLMGIHAMEPLEPVLDPEKMAARVGEAVSRICRDGSVPVVLGGDHSVTIGAVRAVHAHTGRLNIIQFDAHADLRDSYQGSHHSHACVMRRLWELGNCVQVGVRSLSREEMEFLKRQGKSPVWAGEIISDRATALSRVMGSLEDVPTYITIDLDCLDPSVMPAVGTPEPGGPGWHDLVAMLKFICSETEVAGFDVVELSPVPGLHAPDYLAARLVYKMMNYMVA